MRVEHRLQETGQSVNQDTDNREYYFASASVQSRGVIVTVSLGDTAHAMAPLYYASEDGSTKTLIYGQDEACSQQLSFQESLEYLLVGSEYRGRCSRVVDMRTGEVIRSFPDNTSFAVWIEPPKY